MLIPTSVLPSQGVTTVIQELNINPMTYKQLLDYDSKEPKTDAEKIQWDIESLLLDIPNIKEISVYDMIALIVMRKYTSATFNDTIQFPVTCPNCGTKFSFEIPVADIKYKSLDTDLLKINKIIIQGQELQFCTPTIWEFYLTLKEISTHVPNINIKLVYLYSLFGFNKNKSIKRLIDNATHDEITLLNFFYNKISCQLEDNFCKCPGHGGDVAVNLSSSVGNIFHLIELNNPIDREKIIAT